MSTRLSSSSTLPSSTEVPPPDETQSPHSRIHDIPDPSPLSGALRAAGRTFSFGGRFSKSSAPVVPRQETPDASKTRPVTGSTDSTATPPKLPDTNFTLGSNDDFNNMFDNMSSRRQSVMRDPSPQPGKVRPMIHRSQKRISNCIGAPRSPQLMPSPVSSLAELERPPRLTPIDPLSSSRLPTPGTVVTIVAHPKRDCYITRMRTQQTTASPPSTQ